MTIGVGFQVSSDVAQFVQEMQKVQSALSAQNEALKRQAITNAQAREQAKADAQQRRDQAAAEREANKEREKAAAILRSIEEPLDTLNRKSAELYGLFAKGALNARELQKTHEAISNEYYQTTDAAKALAAAEKEKQDAIGRGIQIAASAATPLDKYNAKMADLQQALASGKIGATEFANAHKKLQSDLAAADTEGNRQRERANKLLRDSESPLEKLTRQTAELTTLVKSNALTADQAGKVYAHLEREYDQTTDAAKALAEAEKQKESSIKRGVSIVESARSPHRKYVDDMRDLRTALKDGAITSEEFSGAQRKLKEETRDSLGKQGLSGLAETSVAKLTQLAAGYLGVSKAVELITQAYEDQVALLDSVKQRTDSVATSQAEIIKNYAIAKDVDVEKFVQTSRDISNETRVPLAAINQAIASTISSAGAADPKLIQDSVRTAARIDPNNPEKIEFTAAAITDLANATGEKDTEKLAALLLTGLQTARVTDAKRYFENATKAVGIAIQSNPAQDKTELIREVFALFGAATKPSIDPKGESTGTFVIQELEAVNEIFKDIPERTKELQKDIDKLLEKQRVTNEEALKIKKAEIDLAQKEAENKKAAARPANNEAAKLRQEELAVDVERAREAVLSAKKSAVLDKDDSEKLAAFQAELKGLAGVVDPGTVSSRQKYIAENPELLKTFLESAEKKGEVRYRSFFKGLGDLNDNFTKVFFESIDQISDDPRVAQQVVDRIQKATAELRTADTFRESETNVQKFESTPSLVAASGIRKILEDSYKDGKANADYFGNFLTDAIDRFSPFGKKLTSTDPLTIGEAATAKLTADRIKFEQDRFLGDSSVQTENRIEFINNQLLAVANAMQKFVESAEAIDERARQAAQTTIENIRREADSSAARLQAGRVNP